MRPADRVPRCVSRRLTALLAASALSMALPVTLGAQGANADSIQVRDSNVGVANTRPAGVVRADNALATRQPIPVAPVGSVYGSLGFGEVRDLRSSDRRDAEARRLVQAPAERASWLAPLASVIVPGSGQALLRQQRSLAYAVAEVFLVLRSVQSNRDYRNARDRYRELAADVARAGFGADRPVGPWEYYEEMQKFERSGVYSSGGLDVVIPETDVTTFNGAQWLLAREQYWANADVPPTTDTDEYKRALAYYKTRAVPPNFLWSWRDQSLALDEFRERITESNNSNQRYVTAVGFVAANHLVSLIDAYVTVRMRRYGGAGLSSASLNTRLVPMGQTGDRSYGMAMSVTIPVAGIR